MQDPPLSSGSISELCGEDGGTGRGGFSPVVPGKDVRLGVDEDRDYVTYFFNPRREVLNEQLAQVVEGLEFAGLENKRMEGKRKRTVTAAQRNGTRTNAVCFTYDSLLQTLQVLFSLLVALMQESVGNSHGINRSG